MIDKSNNKYIVNDFHHLVAADLSQAHIVRKYNNEFVVLYNEKKYIITILSEDSESKKWILKVNGYTLHIEKQDSVDQLVNKLGFNSSAKHTLKEVIAPMPGLVLKVLIKEGQNITKGDNLFILEAMKMENIIKAAGEGVVSKIHVEPGTKVDKGQKLASL